MQWSFEADKHGESESYRDTRTADHQQLSTDACFCGKWHRRRSKHSGRHLLSHRQQHWLLRIVRLQYISQTRGHARCLHGFGRLAGRRMQRNCAHMHLSAQHRYENRGDAESGAAPATGERATYGHRVRRRPGHGREQSCGHQLSRDLHRIFRRRHTADAECHRCQWFCFRRLHWRLHDPRRESQERKQARECSAIADMYV